MDFNLTLEKLTSSGQETFDVGKGLSFKEATKAASKFKLQKDHRGVHYDPKTGIITYT